MIRRKGCSLEHLFVLDSFEIDNHLIYIYLSKPTHMPEKHHNFWEELKRRKVIRVIIGYAASAFIILEAVDIIFPRMGLPDWTVTLVIFLLIIGFIFAIIFSWIFDITPEGLKKTVSAKVAKEKKNKPIKRKLKVSDGIIVVLAIIVFILLYPKIFKRKDLDNIKEEDGKISIAVLPCNNTTGDSLYNWYSNGIADILIDGLSLSPELAVIDNQSMFNVLESRKDIQYASINPTIAKEIVSSIQVKSYIWGNYITTQDKLLVNLKLVEKESEKILTTFSEESHLDSLIQIVRILSEQIRNYLEIKSLEQNVIYAYREFATTQSAEAYKYYIEGSRYGYAYSFDLAIESYKKAIEIDTAFTDAYILISMSYGWQYKDKESREYLEKALLSKKKISAFDQARIRLQRAFLDKNIQELIAANEQIQKLMPQSPLHWWFSGNDHYSANQYAKSLDAYERARDLYRKAGLEGYEYYAIRGELNHLLGNHEREIEIYQEALEINPNNLEIIFLQAVCALSQGNITEANNYIEKYRSIRESRSEEDYWINLYIGSIYMEAEQLDEAMKIFNDLMNERPDEPWSKQGLGSILIENDIDIEKGLEIIDKAIQLTPENANPYVKADRYYIKGLGLYKQGKIDDAYEVLKYGWDLRPRYNNHDHYLLLQEVEQALTKQRSDQ